jgi:hypothetical protein
MQDWYVHTMNTEHLRLETLPDLNLELPQINLEHHDMVYEEITETEVEEAIGEADEVSAPGLSGQTIQTSLSRDTRHLHSNNQSASLQEGTLP